MEDLITKWNFRGIRNSRTNHIIIKCENFILIIEFVYKFGTSITTFCRFDTSIFWVSPYEYLISISFISISTKTSQFTLKNTYIIKILLIESGKIVPSWFQDTLLRTKIFPSSRGIAFIFFHDQKNLNLIIFNEIF